MTYSIFLSVVEKDIFQTALFSRRMTLKVQLHLVIDKLVGR